MRVVVTLSAAAAQPWLDLFRGALPGACIERREPGAPAEDHEPPADYVVLAEPCPTVFAAQPAPKAVFAASAGVNQHLRQSNLPDGVMVVRLEDAGMAQPMARYVLAAALRYALRLDVYGEQQRRARWQAWPERAPASVQAGVLGLGVIGGAIARALAGQGFAVRGYATTAKRIAGVACYAGRAAQDAFLADVDFLVNALPLTPATDGFVDARVLARLADGAHVVNVGRGRTLVDADLIAALDRGKLSGATLDVFDVEPLSPAHPYWTHPRVAVTPHVSGPTVPEEAVRQIAAKIGRLERGMSVTGAVDRGRGY
jgi:glyoxylate/hydroxypyruvate reductase A